ncbi:MAG: LUD domain-containing protein [Armatimonadetes bacterium]|nr:LUD domain-containing protein [Armatimonadota bacterium]
MNSKEAILAKIQAAQVPHFRANRPQRKELPASLDAFCERVADYRAKLHSVTEDQLLPTIQSLVNGRRCLVPLGLGFTIQGAQEDKPFSHRELAEFDVTVTLCAVGIEETGTIILDGSEGQGRRALSLIPDHHICIVRESQVVASIEEAIQRITPTRPLTFISGPSATSDIELVRVEGVHGPRRLDVLLVSHT